MSFEEWWNSADRSVTGSLTRTKIACKLAWQASAHEQMERDAKIGAIFDSEVGKQIQESFEREKE